MRKPPFRGGSRTKVGGLSSWHGTEITKSGILAVVIRFDNGSSEAFSAATSELVFFFIVIPILNICSLLAAAVAASIHEC
jgi:hypothetical protein